MYNNVNWTLLVFKIGTDNRYGLLVSWLIAAGGRRKISVA